MLILAVQPVSVCTGLSRSICWYLFWYWGELLMIWWDCFPSSNGGLGPSNRWPRPIFWGKMGGPTKPFSPNNTYMVCLWYWFGKYPKYTDRYWPNIPIQYATLIEIALPSLVRARGNCLLRRRWKTFEEKIILFLEYHVVPYICTLGEFCGLLQLNWWGSRLRV